MHGLLTVKLLRCNIIETYAFTSKLSTVLIYVHQNHEKQVDVLPSKNQALSKYCHISKLNSVKTLLIL